MKAEAVVAEIERFHQRFVASNPLYQCAKAGKVDADMLHEYLVGVEHLTTNTIPTLRRGAHVARRLGHKRLAEYFAHKISEEIGHHEWAQEDQANLAKTFNIKNNKHLGPGVRTLVETQYRIVEEDPYLYLAYMIFTEYFTVLAVPGWVELLETRCSLPPNFMSVLTKHAELDKGHVAECVQEINELMSDYQDEERFFVHLHECFKHYVAFCTDVARKADAIDYRQSA